MSFVKRQGNKFDYLEMKAVSFFYTFCNFSHTKNVYRILIKWKICHLCAWWRVLKKKYLFLAGMNCIPREGTILLKYILFSPYLMMEKLKGSSGDETSTVMQKNNIKLVFLFLTLIACLLHCTTSLKCGLLSSPSQVTSRLEWWIKKAS